jgi:hypothetical protein
MRHDHIGAARTPRVPDADSGDAQETDTPETRAQRLEREHEQLFHELRSIIPGVEVQFAFLLTVAFTQRFETLSDVQRTVYYTTFLCAAASLILLLAPSSFHRVRFRQRDKEAMMRSANVEVLVALVLISFSIAGTVLLISDLMFGLGVAVVVSGIAWLAASTLWWGYPLLRRQQDDD